MGEGLLDPSSSLKEREGEVPSQGPLGMPSEERKALVRSKVCEGPLFPPRGKGGFCTIIK